MKSMIPLVVALSWTSIADATVVSFPGVVREAPSPDGRFSVLNTDQDAEPNHVLSMQDNRLGGHYPLFIYGRHVDVAWSDDSKFVFVNDYAESDWADCVVIDFGSRTQKKISAVMRAQVRDLIKTLDHLYVTCGSWQPNDELIVSIAGHGDKSGKELRFVYNARSGKAVLVR